MPRRGFQESPPQGGIAQFTSGAPPASAVRPLDFSGIQQALSGFTAISMQADAQRAAETAAQEQAALGTEGIAQPAGFMLPSAARAFESRAQTVYEQQLRTEATATATTLLRENMLNPEGFEQSWNAYTEGKLKALQDDPATAAQVGVALADMGVQKRTAIENNVFDRTQAEISVELFASYKKEQDQVLDQILTYPNEAFVVEQIAFLREHISELDESGVLTPKQIGDLEMQLNDSLYGAYMEGAIRESLEAGDMATLQTLHNDLQRGAYFEDNQQALRFAARIASSMGGDVSRGEINAFQDVGRVVLDRVQKGIIVTSEEMDRLDEAFSFLQAFGTPEDQRTFLQNYIGVALTQQLAPLLQDGAISELEDARIQLQDLDLQLASPEVVSGLQDSVQARIDQMRVDAVGNVAAVGISVVRNTIVNGLMSSSDIEIEEFFALQEYNTQLVAQREGLNPRQVIPWTADQISDFAEQMLVAHSREDQAAYGNLQAMYLRAFGNDFSSAVKAMEETSIELAGAMYLGNVLAGDALGDSAAIVHLALTGAKMRNVPANNEAYKAILQRTDAYTDVVYALSAGSGKLNNATTEAIANAMLALQITGNKPADAKTMIETMLDSVQIKEMTNDTLVIPTAFSESPAVATELLLQANNFLKGNEEALGNQYKQFIPVPAGDGVVRFKNMFTGFFLKEPDNITPREISLPQATAMVIQEFERFDASKADEQAKIALENRVTMNNRERDFLVNVGAQVGLSEDEAFNYYRAVSFSPATSMTNLPNGIAPQMQVQAIQESPDRPVGRGYTQEAQQAIESIRGAFPTGPDVRFIPTQTDIQRGATVVRYAELINRFGRDQQKALAAIVSSPEEVEAAVDVYGIDWLSNMVLSVRVFVNRGFGFEDPE